MKKENNVKTLAELINLSVFSNCCNKAKMHSITKQSTIFSFWNDIVGQKFACFTKPRQIKGQKLYISAKSPAVIQELTLYKSKIISKINSYSLPLGLKIDELVFDYKNYYAKESEEISGIEDKPKLISKDEISQVEFNENEFEQYKNSIERINFLDANKKEILLNKVIDNKKAEKFRKNNS